jgi:pimeloyl-ACP methyl ester carboxylesterase
MPKPLLRHLPPSGGSSSVVRRLISLALLVAALPVAASAPASPGAAVTPAVAATIQLTAPTAPASPTAVYPPVVKTTGVPRFEQGKCGFGLPAGAVEGKDVKCGTLVVYEEHADPSSPTLRLAVAIVPSQNAKPLPDPLVFNQGGPGFGSIDTYLSIMLASPFRGHRDQIAFDQRGTGYSQPALACPEVIDETIATLDQNLSVPDANARYNAATLQCRDRLVHAGVNLSAYNTQESAADIEDLRQALGYQQLNLYGVSYGSLLVLDTLRFFPHSVRSAVIDGVVPPQSNMNTNVPRTEDRAFTELFKACAADATCNTAYPRLEDTFFNLVSQLNEKPATIHLIDPDTGQTYTALLNGDAFVGAVFQAMYESDLVPAIPEIIHRATQGDFSAVEPIVAIIDLDRNWMIAMYWSVYCAEDANFDPASLNYSGVRPELAKDQDANNQAIKSLCQAWKVRDLSPVLNTPVSSTVPTLVLNGRFDPITPPSNGLLAAQTLSNSTVITVPTTAHGAYPAGGECVSRIMSAFVDNPALAVDSKCIAALPAISFATSGNLVNFSVVGLANAVVARRASLLLTVLGLLLAMLALLSGIVLFPLSWLLKRGARPPDDAAGMDPAAMAGGAQAAAVAFPASPQADAGLLLKLAPWLAILSGLLPIAFAAAFIYTVGPLVRNNNGILLLGLPGSLTWVFLLPLVNAAIVLLLLLATLLGLISKDWSGRRKLYFLFLSLSGITLVVMLSLLGLLTALWGQVVALVRGLIGV